MTISRREKDGAQSIISCMVYLIMDDMIFKLKKNLFLTKFRCQIQGMCGGTNTVIYHVLTLGKPEKKSSLVQFHVLPCN